MKTVATALAVLLFVGCASVEPPKSTCGMHLTEDQLEQCRGAGGCTVSSQDHLMSLMEQAYEKGKRDGAREQRAACWANVSNRFDGNHL